MMPRWLRPSPRWAAVILCGWLLAPALLSAWFILQAGAPVPQGLAIVGLAAAVYAVPLIFLRPLRRFFLFWLPAGWLSPLYCYLTFFFGSVPGAGFVASVMRTNAQELTGTLVGFGWVVLLAPVCWLAYLALVWRLEQSDRLPTRGIVWLIGSACAYGAFGLLTTQGIGAPSKELGLLDHDIWTDSFPTAPIAGVMDYIEDSFRSEGAHHITATAPEQPALFILIIGETLRADHLGINGYPRDTTPNLQRRASELISYTNVSAAANYTYIAVPYIVGQRLPSGGRVDLVAAFNAAGFHTAWISNQDENVYPAPAETRYFSNANWRSSPHYDTALLPKLQACLNQCGPRQLIVMHLLGSHFPYEARYHPSRRFFTPTLDDGPAVFDPSNRARFVNSYDNTIRATDDLVERVLQQVSTDGRPAVVMLTADHGENLYDDQRHRILHSSKQATRAEAIVPLVVWANAAFRRTHETQLRLLQQHATQPVTQTAITPTLVELADLRFSDRDDTQSLASPRFQRPGKRLIIQADAKRVDVDQLH